MREATEVKGQSEWTVVTDQEEIGITTEATGMDKV